MHRLYLDALFKPLGVSARTWHDVTDELRDPLGAPL
jgi:hypothetical protein